MVLAFAAASCSSKDEVPETPGTPEPPKENWYLHGWELKNLTNPTDVETVKLEYNADSTIKRRLYYLDGIVAGDESSIEAATYENGHLAKFDIYLQTETPFNSTSYEYKNGRVVRGLNYTPIFGSTQLELMSIDSFFFDNDNQLIANKKYFQKAGYPATPEVTEYTWLHGNVMTAKHWQTIDGKPTVLNSYTFEYSNLKNFSQTYFNSEFVTLRAVINGAYARSRNLCTKRINVSDATHSDTLYIAYTFAENGLPAGRQMRTATMHDGKLTEQSTSQVFDFRKLGAN